MKILIIGANGFLGKEITTLFLAHKIDFMTSSRSTTTDFSVDISNIKNFEVVPKNFFDVIINCATTLPGPDYLDANYLEKIYQTNILGSQNICKWIHEQSSIKKIINCSSLAVVNKPWPLNVDETANTYPTGTHVLYSGSKLMQELIFETFANQYQISLIQLRFSALYGINMPKSGIIWNFINQAQNKNCISVENGDKFSADFLNVIDAARIILGAVNSHETGIVNAASGTEVFLTDLANNVSKMFANTEVINVSSTKNFNENRAVIDVQKLSKIIDVNSFIDFEKGLKQLINR